MIQAQGNSGVKLIECLNPRKQTYVVRWNVLPLIDENGEESENAVTYMEEKFDHKPTLSEIKATVTAWYNSEIDKRIVSGFVFNDNLVWLSTENQFNYKAAYDLAIQTDGQNLPIVFKVGTDEEPKYIQFNTVSELQNFYIGAMNYVQKTLAAGWVEKDSINWSAYGVD